MARTATVRSISVTSFVPLARALAAKVSPEFVDDLTQEGLIALSRALQRTPQLSFPLARTILQRAQWRAHMRWHRDVSALAGPVEEQLPVVDQQNSFFDELERCCGPQARRVAENLVEPQDPQVVARIKSRCTRRQVRLGLGIKRNEWNRLLDQIRAFTYAWVRVR